MKVGMATGEPQLFSYNKTTGRMDYFGTLINRAARLCGRAAPGQTIGDQETADGLGKSHDVVTLGLATLKGIRNEVEVFCVADEEMAGRRAIFSELTAMSDALASPDSPMSPGAMSPSAE